MNGNKCCFTGIDKFQWLWYNTGIRSKKESMEELKYNQKVWVSDDGDKWEERYYVGRFDDRSFPFAVCKNSYDPKSYPNGEVKIETYRFLSAVCPIKKYRPFKDGLEAVTAVGKKVRRKSNKSVRYVAVYKTGVLLCNPGSVNRSSYSFLTFKQAFDELEFADDNGVFGVKEE